MAKGRKYGNRSFGCVLIGVSGTGAGAGRKGTGTGRGAGAGGGAERAGHGHGHGDSGLEFEGAFEGEFADLAPAAYQ